MNGLRNYEFPHHCATRRGPTRKRKQNGGCLSLPSIFQKTPQMAGDAIYGTIQNNNERPFFFIEVWLMHEELTRKGEQTQSRIMEAAYVLFMSQGYHGTSMRQIAQRAGLTLGGVYAHFASKEEIWKAVLFERHPYHTILPVLRATEGKTVETLLRNAARRLVGELEKRSDLLHLMFIEIVEFNGMHLPALYEQIAPELTPLFDVIQAGEGRLRAIPPLLLVRSFLGFFFSYYITEAMMPPSLRSLMGEDALEVFIDIYLHGVMA
ncbi:TetR/AcrR family transcriptional regulator [Caldilinea sp.]|uniref:TetR/AcrR family transcriptional regulator n=2 Tax=Caldilinea sp. TaxID=2293560 RepID=UPI00263306CE|nr:TetR/AcrR family transcriptional regulator [uncultured Caldilinea sp.]